MMNKVKLIALYGRSGAGKDTVKRMLLDGIPNSKGIVKFTTRPPRAYEVNGKDYHFISDSEFESLILSNLMLEVTFFNQWAYGSSTLSLDRDNINIGVFDLKGLSSIMEDERLDVIPIEICSCEAQLLKRSIDRIAPSEEGYREICRRFIADQDDWKKYAETIEECRTKGIQFINSYSDVDCLREAVNKLIESKFK